MAGKMGDKQYLWTMIDLFVSTLLHSRSVGLFGSHKFFDRQTRLLQKGKRGPQMHIEH